MLCSCVFPKDMNKFTDEKKLKQEHVSLFRKVLEMMITQTPHTSGVLDDDGGTRSILIRYVSTGNETFI